MIRPEEKQVLTDLVEIVNSLNIPTILVGAGARILVFDRQFGEGRSTKDWDVAVSIDSWQAYQDLADCLTTGDSPRFKSTKNYHKFVHIETAIEVDIVPFGEISEPDREIIWADTGNSMNVAGFAEALLYAKTIDLGELTVRVVDTPAFIVLKIFAWGDRGERTNKDLEDIDFILGKYEDDERAYEDLADELASGAVDFLDASIYLLGRDISKILQAKTLSEFYQLLSRLIDRPNSSLPELNYRLQVLERGVRSINPSSYL